MCIILNTLVLALDSHPIEPQMETAIEYTNLVFYFIFLAEMIIKLFGLGWNAYTRDRSNIFDFVIVIISTIDVAITYSAPLFIGDNAEPTEKGALQSFGTVS